jgi:hypothetical protein
VTHGEITTDGELCLLAFFAAELSVHELRNVSAMVAEVCLPKAPEVIAQYPSFFRGSCQLSLPPEKSAQP